MAGATSLRNGIRWWAITRRPLRGHEMDGIYYNGGSWMRIEVCGYVAGKLHGWQTSRSRDRKPALGRNSYRSGISHEPGIPRHGSHASKFWISSRICVEHFRLPSSGTRGPANSRNGSRRLSALPPRVLSRFPSVQSSQSTRVSVAELSSSSRQSDSSMATRFFGLASVHFSGIRMKWLALPF